MENRSFVELLEDAFDAGRRHDQNELNALKKEARAAGAGIMVKTERPSQEAYSFRELSLILDSLSIVDHMIDSKTPRWVVEQQAADIIGRLSDKARELAVGRIMYYAIYDDEELAGRRWTVDAMYIADVSYQGLFKCKNDSRTGSGHWISMDDLDSDRIFWHWPVAEEFCKAMNLKEAGH